MRGRVFDVLRESDWSGGHWIFPVPVDVVVVPVRE